LLIAIAALLAVGPCPRHVPRAGSYLMIAMMIVAIIDLELIDVVGD
jgi:hypothetical protein